MKWTNELLDAMRQETDPVADDMVRRIVADEGHEGARWLFHILIRNIDMPFDQVPAYVHGYMEDHGSLPPDIDQARIRRGQEVFADLGPWFALALYYKSLPTAYLNVPGVKVLHFTGRTEKGREWPAQYARRLAETTQFVLDVMVGGNLEAHAKGIRTALKVRLVHASIRYFFLSEGASEPDTKEMPINQEDLAMTLMTFSISMIEAAEQLGRPLAPQEAEDFLYAWRLVGLKIGIRPELIPDNVQDGRDLLERILERHQGPSPEGRALTSALMEFSDLLTPGKLTDNLGEVLTTLFLGSNRAQMLGVQLKQGCFSLLLPKVLKIAFKLTEESEEKNAEVARRSNEFGILFIKAMMGRMMQFKGRGLDVPQEFRDKWGV
jgi:hypothetical protein